MTGANAVWKRTPVRLAATFTALFATTVIVLFAILFFGITARLTDQIRLRAEETMESLLAVDRQKGFDDLTAVVTGESGSVPMRARCRSSERLGTRSINPNRLGSL